MSLSSPTDSSAPYRQQNNGGRQGSASTPPPGGSPASPNPSGSAASSPKLRGHKQRAGLVGPAIVLLCCFAFDACTLLPLNLHGGKDGLGDAIRNFNTAVADLWLWLFIRVGVAIATVAISLFVFSSAPTNSLAEDEASANIDDGTSSSISLNTQGDSDSRPLLGGDSGSPKRGTSSSPSSLKNNNNTINNKANSNSNYAAIHGHATAAGDVADGVGGPLPMYKNEPLLKSRDRSRIMQGKVKLALLCVMFLLHVSCNVFVAVKAMRFGVHNGDEYGMGIRLDKLGLAATLLCLHVLSCSVELFVTSALLSRASLFNSYVKAPDGSWLDDHDVDCPLLHPHPLKYISRTVMSSCNVCSTRFRVNDRKFTCDICDFNTCSQCLETKIEQFNLATRQAAAGGASLNTDGILTAASDKTVNSIGRVAYAKRIAVIANQFRGVLFAGLACLVISQVVNIILPKYQGNVVDAVVKKDSDAVMTDIEWYVGLGLARLLFSSIRTYCTMMTSQYATNTVRIMLFQALTQRSVAFFDATSTGALQSRLSSDATQMVSPLSTLFNDTISNILVLFGATIMAFIVSWKLALLSFTVLGPIVYLTSSYAQVSRRLVRQIRDSVAEGGSISNQVLTSIRTVKGFANEEFEVERYSDALLQAVSIAIKNAAAAVAIGLATNVMDVGIMALTLGFGSYLILNYPDELSIGELITFQLYANMMNSSYKAINNSLNELTKSAGAAERVLALMDVPPVPENEESSNYKLLARNGKRFGASPCFSIRFDNVHFRYPNRPINQVLKGLTFTCQPGRVTALVGPSGSGKSTVVQLLQRFYGCNNGTIRIGVLEKASAAASAASLDNSPTSGDGANANSGQQGDGGVMIRQVSSNGTFELAEELSLHEISRADWLSDVAVVAQDTQLFSTTVFENITYGITNTRAYDGVASKSVDTSAKNTRKLLRAAKEATAWQRRNAAANSTKNDGDVPSGIACGDDIYSDLDGPADGDDKAAEAPEEGSILKSVVSFEDVVAAAKKAQAHDFIMKLPEGYHTPIGERGCTLSGGQRQRLAIARALLRKPKLLLLDEATSALDNESEALVQKAIDDLLATERSSDRCTVLVIAHRLTTIQNADNIVVLENGVVREEGSHAHLSTAGGLYQSFLASGFPKDSDGGASKGSAEGGRGRGGGAGGKRGAGRRE